MEPQGRQVDVLVNVLGLGGLKVESSEKYLGQAYDAGKGSETFVGKIGRHQVI